MRGNKRAEKNRGEQRRTEEKDQERGALRRTETSVGAKALTLSPLKELTTSSCPSAVFTWHGMAFVDFELFVLILIA
jgi:hypothetical protein